MKATHKLLFVLCPMLVLVFIYYSSGKLHLYVWGQKPHVDVEPTVAPTVKPKPKPKVTTAPVSEDIGSENRIIDSVMDQQGFLLDGKLMKTQAHSEPSLNRPQELVYKYGNLTAANCKQGYAAAKMTAIYPKFVQPAPMFLDRNFKRLAKVTKFLPPFGFKSQERIIDTILTTTKKYGLSPELDRLNEAPVKGYTKDVGTKTTMRITYPEGAIQKSERYEKDSLFVFIAFKPLDFKWLRHMIFKEKLQRTEGFWKSVASKVPREPWEMRILNPYFIQEAAFQFIGLPLNNGVMGKGNIPTLGTVAITMALHNCDEVAVAGFGYDMNTPHAPLHYYESVKMSAIKESWTHNIVKEKEFLKKLVKADVIEDLTKGI
uniref:ST3 beta-galactoside alpha-2,3-sialyltransferase 3b n=1 Tax=Astyanax mexicanus TaxID=7994 RepID=A0A3B1JKK1_ASTMX